MFSIEVRVCRSESFLKSAVAKHAIHTRLRVLVLPYTSCISQSVFFSQTASTTLESSVHLGMELSLRMSAKNPLLNATSTNDLPTLHSLLNDKDRQPFPQIAQLDDQDRQLFSQIAKNGTPETAAYLLSRHSVPEDYSRDVTSSNPTVNPIQYLACGSASNGNAALFHYLINQYPSLISTWNHNIENILVNAIEGGVGIWKIILDHDPHWKDHEFGAHRECVLELVVEYEQKELLEFLLKEGADTDRAGAPVLEEARLRGADSETLELIKKYSV